MPLTLHAVFEILALMVGFQLFLRRQRAGGDGVAGDDRLWLLVGAAAGALVGSRALGLLEHRSIVRLDATLPLVILGTKTIVGGLLGGLVGVEVTKRRLGIERSTGDPLVGPIVAGMVVGRIGCHLAGVADGTHGLPSDLPWAIDLGDGLRRHPTALYEIAFLVVVGALLAGREGRWPAGAVFATFLSAYLAFRLAVDFLKPGEPLLGPLTPIQLAAAAGLVYYAGRATRWRSTGPGGRIGA